MFCPYIRKKINVEQCRQEKDSSGEGAEFWEKATIEMEIPIKCLEDKCAAYVNGKCGQKEEIKK